MKQLNLLIRIALVGIIWSLVFATFWRSLIYGLWGFDPAYNKHWIFLWQMWKDGWVIDTSSEWAFLVAILLFLPVWLIGWLIFANIPWGQKLCRLLQKPYEYLKKLHRKYFMPRVLVITRRKSYRKIRPIPLHYVVPSSRARAKPGKSTRPRKDGKDADKMYAKMEELSGKKTKRKPKGSGYVPTPDEIERLSEQNNQNIVADIEKEEGLTRQEILDSLRATANASETDEIPLIKEEPDSVKMDNLRNQPPPAWDYAPEPDEEKEPPTEEEKLAMRTRAIEDARDMLKVKGFKVFEKIKIANTEVNFIGLSGDKVVLCFVDTEEGDWLADEEIVNNEKPMWFSEKRHRVSPVYNLFHSALTLRKKLKLDDRIACENIVMIEGGNVINAADMEDTWINEDTKVCRIGTGAPVSLPHFMEIAPDTDRPVANEMIKLFKKTFKI